MISYNERELVETEKEREMKYWKLAGAIAISEIAGGIGAIFTSSKIPTWYATLQQPSWNPPAWLFGPVWTILYATMGVSLWLLWQAKDTERKRAAMVLFWAQLAMNVLWSEVFFGLQNPGLGVAVILMLLFLIMTLIDHAWKVNRWAGMVLVPYAAWVAFATVLNYTVWQLNR